MGTIPFYRSRLLDSTSLNLTPFGNVFFGLFNCCGSLLCPLIYGSLRFDSVAIVSFIFHVCSLKLCSKVCSNRVGHSYCPFACVSEWLTFNDVMCRWRVGVLKDFCAFCDCKCLLSRNLHMCPPSSFHHSKNSSFRDVFVYFTFASCGPNDIFGGTSDYEMMMLCQYYLAVSLSTGTCSRLQQCKTRGTAAFVAFNLW